jgi:hypothetical protein
LVPEVNSRVSANEKNTSFERWALLGALALGLVGFAAFLSRHGSPTAALEDDEASTPSDLVHLRIGGERPPAPDPWTDDGTGDDDQIDDAGGGAPAPDDSTGPAGPVPTREVIVQPGETLGQIVARELGTVTRLAEVCRLNGIEDPDSIRAGMTLLLPEE